MGLKKRKRKHLKRVEAFFGHLLFHCYKTAHLNFLAFVLNTKYYNFGYLGQNFSHFSDLIMVKQHYCVNHTSMLSCTLHKHRV